MPACGDITRPAASRRPSFRSLDLYNGRIVLRRLLMVLGLAGLAAGAVYLGIRGGMSFERNRLCCNMPLERNLGVAVRETFGLVQYASQIGQDRWVSKVAFLGVNDGFFLDVGSGDGYVDSNTWALERLGWKGICIDPYPVNMEGRTCRVVPKVVDAAAGRTVRFSQAGVVGGITEYLGRWKSLADRARTTEFVTVTLADVLEEAAAPRFIHFISLDIEGAEYQALRGFPFDRYEIGALAIEHNFEEPKRTQIAELLASKGYERTGGLLHDDFYLRRSMIRPEAPH
jgi:FkbM family methyltransferase